VRTYETVGGGSSEGAGVDPGVTWDAVNSWFTSTVTRVAGSTYRLLLRFDPSGLGGTALTDYWGVLPTYTMTTAAGIPRIATLSVSVPAAAGDVELLFTTGDAPVGSQVNAYTHVQRETGRTRWSASHGTT
jgi:hypothetical protein